MESGALKQKIIRLIFPAALILPCALMTANFTYDEFWSLINFAPLNIFQILTDLSLPNNHPLNTLFLKVFSAVSAEPLILRLPSIICGAFIPVLCGQLAYKWSTKNRISALISAAVLAALSVPIAVYCGVARGYALQLLCLLGVLWSMTLVKENSRKGAVWMAVFAIGTFLSVPTGALFLIPAGIGFLIYSGKEVRKNKDIWIAAAVVALAGMLFYGVNFSALRAGQDWGSRIDSLAGFGRFLGDISGAILLIPATLAALAALICQPRRWIAFLLLCCPVLLAVFSNGGPARCYLYLSAAIAVAGGIGISEVVSRTKYKEYICGAVAVILGVTGIFCQLKKWQFTDYVAVFEKNQAEIPQDMLPVYRATALYPVKCGAVPGDLKKFNQQLAVGNFRQIGCFECEEGVFNGMDASYAEAQLVTGLKGKKLQYNGLPCVVYNMFPAESISVGNCCLLLLPSWEKLPETLEKSGKMLYLDLWISAGMKVIFFQCESAMEQLPSTCRIYLLGEMR